MIYVYELYDLYGNVVYVGETANPRRRMFQHVGKKGNHRTGHGKFEGQSVVMHIVSQHDTKEDARLAEGALKLQYGLEWTERHSFLYKHSKEDAHKVRMGVARKIRKLTFEDAQAIRGKYKPREYSYKMLANEYDVAKQTIIGIVKNRIYTEL